jgi:predicted TIM-barrel fold metal-dependent hydrolase
MSSHLFGSDNGDVVLSRRDLLTQGGAALVLAGRGGIALAAAGRHRIDVHHHFVPPQYLEEAPPPARDMLGRYGWTAQKSLEEMDQNGVDVALLSFPMPFLWFPGVDQGRRLARMCNDYCADVVQQHPRRFGLLATLPPLKDTEGCLQEIAYAYGSINSDGVTVRTNYSGLYLGDASFNPVWNELNRRKAVVFVHPANAACCMSVNDSLPAGYDEWPFDTARTVMSLLANEAHAKWPNIRFVFAHGGGVLPMIADRINNFGRPGPNGGPPINDAHEFIRTLYFDVANAVNPPALAATRAMTDPTHLLFGTDFPFIPTRRGVEYMTRAGLLTKQLVAIERGNALDLLPRLRAGAVFQPQREPETDAQAHRVH